MLSLGHKLYIAFGVVLLIPPALLLSMPRYTAASLLKTNHISHGPDDEATIGQLYAWAIQLIGVYLLLFDIAFVIKPRLAFFALLMGSVPLGTLVTVLYGGVCYTQPALLAAKIPEDDPHATAEAVRQVGHDLLILGGVLIGLWGVIIGWSLV